MISASIVFPFRARQLPLLIGLPTALLLLVSALSELKPGLVRRFQGGIGALFAEGIGDRTGAVVSSLVEAELPPFRCLLIGGAWFFLSRVFSLYSRAIHGGRFSYTPRSFSSSNGMVSTCC